MRDEDDGEIDLHSAEVKLRILDVITTVSCSGIEAEKLKKRYEDI